MNGLQEQFVSEARELIHVATEDLIAAEREGFLAERIDRVFRAFHTLKGAAGVVDLPAMGVTMHAAEDLLAAVSAGRIVSSPAVIDQILACLDQVSNWVDSFEVNQAEPERAGDDALKMVNALRTLLAPTVSAAPAHAWLTNTSAGLPDWARRLVESSRGKATGADQDQSAPLNALSYQPHAGCFFDGDDPLGLMRRVPQLLALRIEQRAPWPPLAELDPFSCNLHIQALSAATRAELATLFRLVPDQVRIVEVPSNLPANDRAALVKAVIEEQKQVLGLCHGRDDHSGRIGSATRTIANALRHHGNDDWAKRVTSAGASVSQSNLAPLLSVIEDASSALARGGAEKPSGPDGEAIGHTSRLLRVDESKVDTLLELAGELLVVKNGFAHLAKRMEVEGEVREIARTISGQQDALERLAAELYSAILQLRMVPVAQVFRPFSRLVRDMAQRLSKNVRLVTHGETTESDKTIIDLLFEPLLHLVRNALDHGVETPEQRRAIGKPEFATITLGASRTGDRCVVEVIDDGRGIDPAGVRRKAAEKQFLSAAELAALSDEQVVELIFSSGFSTASEVSDISGRGVGMDVVRSSTERIGGRVSLKSQVGAGTTVKLDLPTSIAVLRIMVVEAGGQSFGIPMDAVAETIRLSPSQISRIKNNDGFVHHDRVVPICSLAELMNLPTKSPTDTDARLVVVAENAGSFTAIEVDAIRERMEVVLKPMQGLLSNARGYAGTTLTADGAVLLVLDMKEIVP